MLKIARYLFVSLIFCSHSVSVVAQSVTGATKCDLLAADPKDSTRVAPGIAASEIDVSKAIVACRTAVEKHPKIARFQGQLARALWQGNYTREALSLYERAVQTASKATPEPRRQTELALRRARFEEKTAIFNVELAAQRAMQLRIEAALLDTQAGQAQREAQIAQDRIPGEESGTNSNGRQTLSGDFNQGPETARARALAIQKFELAHAAMERAFGAMEVAQTAEQEEERAKLQLERANSVLTQLHPNETLAETDVVRILFGTDRKVVAETDGYFSGERASELSVGELQVTVPSEHSIGVVERPWSIVVVGISFGFPEDSKNHFTIHSVDTLDKDSFRTRLATSVAVESNPNHEALLFVHGYNTSFEAAAYRTAQIAHDLRYEGVPLLYSWPSDGKLTSYEYDQNSARRAREYLREFIELAIMDAGVKSINVIAHSMGNDPLLETLTQLNMRSNQPPLFNEIILAAPDIDADLFPHLVEAAVRIADGVSLYVSGSDRAMDASRVYAAGVPRAGDVPDSGPIILHGIDTIDATAVSSDILSLNHSNYADNRILLQDIGLLLSEGLRPPARRNPTLIERNLPIGVYWQFPR